MYDNTRIFSITPHAKHKIKIGVDNMATKKVSTGGLGNEPWYKSRRIWASALSLIATIAVVIFPESFDIVIAIGTALAGTLGITSWVKPTKN